jgi:hypothetical protein
MAKGQDLSHHQRKIVNRYYEHRDTIMLTKLSEVVSDLYLCESEKKAGALWKSAATALKNAGADTGRAARVVETRDVKGLASLVNELQSGKR